MNFLKKHWFSIAVILLAGFLYLRPALSVSPFNPDNLGALSIGERNPASFFSNQLATYLPAYRPVGQLSMWIQYQIIGVDHIYTYFLVNVLIWMSCAFLLYLIIYDLTNMRSAGILGSVALLLDNKVYSGLIWVGERQSLLSVLFGLIAILFITSWGKKNKSFGWPFSFVVAGLLICSYLSKEYGLAFVPAVVLLAYKYCRKSYHRILIMALISALAYFGMRFGFSRSQTTAQMFCEDMGYFNTTRTICYSDISFAEKIKQYGYNVFATFFGTYIHFLFSVSGKLDEKYQFVLKELDTLVLSAIIFFSNAWAIMRRFSVAIPFLSLIFANSLLSFMLFRSRNHLVALVGLYILFAIGYALFFELVKKTMPRVIVTAIVFFLIIAVNGVSIRSDLRDYVVSSKKYLPCQALQKYPLDTNKQVVEKINRLYGLEQCK